jgi:hypothetical protein
MCRAQHAVALEKRRTFFHGNDTLLLRWIRLFAHAFKEIHAACKRMRYDVIDTSLAVGCVIDDNCNAIQCSLLVIVMMNVGETIKRRESESILILIVSEGVSLLARILQQFL